MSRELTNKTILVTGATGIIGSELVNYLMLLEGTRIIAMSRSEKKLKEVFSHYLDSDRFRVIAQDITNPLPGNIGKLDFIFHAASPIVVQAMKETPLDVINPNLKGVTNCLEFLREQKCGRLVVFSSATVYGESDDGAVKSEEDTALAESLDSVTAPYSESKRMAEVITRAYVRQYGVDAVIVRMSFVYGYSYFAPDTAFYEFISKALSGGDIFIKASAIRKRDNIYLKDAVSGICHAARFGASGEAYNISSGGMLDNYMAADKIAEIIVKTINEKCGKNISLRYEHSDIKTVSGNLIDNRKTMALGWRPEYSMTDGIGETIELYLRRKNGKD